MYYSNFPRIIGRNNNRFAVQRPVCMGWVGVQPLKYDSRWVTCPKIVDFISLTILSDLTSYHFAAGKEPHFISK